MPVTLFPGSKTSIYATIIIAVLLITGISYKRVSLINQLKNNEKKYSIVLNEEEIKNHQAIKGFEEEN